MLFFEKKDANRNGRVFTNRIRQYKCDFSIGSIIAKIWYNERVESILRIDESFTIQD